MKVLLTKTFQAQVKQLKPAQQRRLKLALETFRVEPRHPALYNHPLSGKWAGHRSIAFGGDWRAHYQQVDGDTASFVAVGTHAQLYE